MYRVRFTSGLVAIAALAFCQDLRASCSALPELESGIQPEFLMTKGSHASYCQFPWMVLITQPTSSSVCGGTIITSRWILTAAHCIAEPPREFIVTFGEIDQSLVSTNQSSQGVTMKTSQGAIHPYYLRPGDYDIGLLKTPEKIPFNDYIQPIRLAGIEEMHKIYDNMDGLIVGWGMDTDSGQPTRNLKFGHQRIMSNSECILHRLGVDSSIMCTSGRTPSVLCEGDSGGPLIVRDGNEAVQIGIIITKKGSACENQSPHVFTRITSYNDWIKDVTGVSY